MIPALGGSRPATAEAKPLEVGAGAILILDEALPVRRALVEILGKLGVQGRSVHEGASPEEGLVAFRAFSPRLVFTEFMGVQPDEGLDMIHEMLEHRPDAKIVLLTAEARDAPEVRAAIRAGVFAHVEKPLRHEKIRQVLGELESEEGGIERFR